MKIEIPKVEYVEKEVRSKKYEETIKGLKALKNMGIEVSYNESFTETGWEITVFINSNKTQGYIYKGEWEERHDYHVDPMPIWSRRTEVEPIVYAIHDYIDKYGHVTVADVYDTISTLEPNFKYRVRYIDNKYGWTKTSQIKIILLIGGYTIRLDEPEQLG